ncbi:MAG: aminoglycoside phosphotransferase family protein [Deltaproteobacteria bacterium]|nr:aminoglycoside phosphotransferase family protein [Deltaproteobacteria bacterium]
MDAEPITSEALRILKNNYLLEVRELKKITSGKVNITFQVELKDSSEPLILQRINPFFLNSLALGDNLQRVSETLTENGLKAPKVILDHSGELLTWSDSQDTVWRLISFIPGVAPQINPKTARGMGRALGLVHQALNIPKPIDLFPLPFGEFTNQKLPRVQDFLDFAHHYSHHPHLPILQEDLKKGVEAARNLPGNPAFQLVFLMRDLVIHGDPKKDNFLECEEEFCLIDWDTVSYGDPLIDLGELCRSLGARSTSPLFDVDLAHLAVEGYRETGLDLPPDHYRLLGAVIRGLSLNLARRYLTDALLETYFVWDKEKFPSLFEQNKSRAEALLALVFELLERDFELLDL